MFLFIGVSAVLGAVESRIVSGVSAGAIPRRKHREWVELCESWRVVVRQERTAGGIPAVRKVDRKKPPPKRRLRVRPDWGSGDDIEVIGREGGTSASESVDVGDESCTTIKNQLSKRGGSAANKCTTLDIINLQSGAIKNDTAPDPKVTRCSHGTNA